MPNYKKKDFPVSEIRRYLEPGPAVLISSAWKGQINIMTQEWHTVISFEPSLILTFIWDANHSFEMLRRSRECVINIPESHLLETVIGVGNCSGAEVDKFERFGLTPEKGTLVGAPLIKECYANFECKLADSSLINKRGLFIWEVVKAHVATSPKFPETVHYRGNGQFMISGKTISRRSKFKPENL